MKVTERYCRGLEIENEDLQQELRIMKELFTTNCKIITDLVREKKGLMAEIKKLNEILERIDGEWAVNENGPCGAATHDKGTTKLTTMIISMMGGFGND